jgi:hypothetical protein
MINLIHILGASGSGTTTLGRTRSRTVCVETNGQSCKWSVKIWVSDGTNYREYQLQMRSMMFPPLTIQNLTIDGSWQEDDQYLRFTGIIASSAPFVILSLLKHGETYHYMKHNKSDALDVATDLFQGKFPLDNR